MDRLRRKTSALKAARSAAVWLGLIAAGVIGGCAGGGSGGGLRSEPRLIAEPNRPLWQEPKAGQARSAPPPDAAAALEVNDGREALAGYAVDLQSLFDQLQTPPPEEPPAEMPLAARARPDWANRGGQPSPAQVPVESPPVFALEDDAPPPVTTNSVADAPEPPPIELTDQERRTELLAQLTTLLARAAGQGQADARPSGPLARAVQLAVLEAIEPGIAKDELDRVEAELLPAEAAVIRPLRDLFSRLGSSALGEQDPAAIAELMREYSRKLAQARPLALPAAILCERVESFGRYTPLRATTFAAGREHAAILYVEVENFTQRSVAGDASAAAPEARGEQWITELGQALDLHHDADGSLQWRQAEQVVRDASRRKRSDYYLVQRITLPRTLSVGRYNLKVTVTDKVSGMTAQARIPIQIVADPSLAKSP